MRTKTKTKTVVSTGLALFAMFFGAGNMVFPLQLGVISGQHIADATLGFLLTGVGFPFLGLFAISLYEGDYWKFFKLLGKPISLLIVSFLIVIICFTIGAPRTELITFDTLAEHVPLVAHHNHLFSLFYFGIVFLIVFRPSRTIDVIGWILSPIKIATFAILILAAIYFSMPLIHTTQAGTHLFETGITTGYGTMDLLAAIFFCTVAYKNIVNKCHEKGVYAKETIQKVTLIACCVGAFFIAVIYVGLIWSAGLHAAALQGVPTSALIGKIAFMLLGKYGFAFVAVCVSFACLATAAALAEVAVDFFKQFAWFKSIPRSVCLVATLSVMYISASFGFASIMGIAMPILTVLYPVMIFLCVINIVRKCKCFIQKKSPQMN